MAVTLILGLVFFISSLVLWYRVSQRLPELIAIPEDAIRGRLAEGDTAVIRLIMRVRALWDERYLQVLARSLGAKGLQKIHIVLMRLDNGVVGIMRKIRLENGLAQAGAASADRKNALPLSEASAREEAGGPIRLKKSRAEGVGSEASPTIKTIQFSTMRAIAPDAATPHTEPPISASRITRRKRVPEQSGVQARTRRPRKKSPVEESRESPVS